MFTFNQNSFIFFFKTVVAIFFLILSLYFLNNKFESGDKAHFYKNLQLIKIVDWPQAIASKIPLTYILLVYPLSFLIKDYGVLRLVNIILNVAARWLIPIYIMKIIHYSNLKYDKYYTILFL